ncbi:ABC transporter substrate-binding protein [Vibrio variabilis]|uniref:ABC transporter substrate-binding protein n=1 Tax=Vibrio variabilis TaxID=990271 RepID=UPI0013A6B42B|nr:ABC transporter substrate-binding protein [Vibrio variabilis]
MSTSKGINPALASQWHVSEDGLMWTFELRSDVLFHDSTQLSAQDVKISLEAAWATHGTLKRAPIAGIYATELQQVKIRLNRPFPMLGMVLASYSNAILSRNAFDSEGAVRQLIGTGPFKLHTFAPPHKVVVERFDNYWGQVASIEHATYLTGHRAESRVLQAKSGEADIVFTIDPSTFSQLRTEPTVNIVSQSIPRTLLLKLNSGHEFLDSVETRNALSLAINREGIARQVLHDSDMASDQLLPNSFPKWHMKDRSNTPQNIELSIDLLEKQGWLLNAKGMRERDGKLFELTLLTYADRLS